MVEGGSNLVYERGGLAIDIQDFPNLTIWLIGVICAHTSFLNIENFINVTTMMQKETGEDCAYMLVLEGTYFSDKKT